jgi:tetratricopeptide (TPR) repeat protein
MVAWQQAKQYLNTGRSAPALAGYRDLVRQFPGVAQLWAELGLAAAGELEFSRADQAFRRAMELAPADAALLVFLSAQYSQLRRMDQALACLKRAVEVDPSSASARLALASWLERTRRLDEAWECVESCLARHPKDAQLLQCKALLLHRKGLNTEAESALRDLLKSDPLLPLHVKSNALYLLGRVLDALAQYPGALACLGEAKKLRQKMEDTTAFQGAYDKMDRGRRELLAKLTPETVRRWRDEAAGSPCPHPLASLGGVARSGTTLLEQVLGANPEILVFDETLSFAREVVSTLYPPMPAPWLTFKSLNDLTATVRARLIGRYFKSLLRETDEISGARLLLDKNLATTAWLYIWLRLFPQSKIVVALRDPRDVIISCYFQNFPFSWATVGFLSLKGTARFYADTMDVWLRLRELGGFDWIETRYEDVVGNLEGEGRRLMNFLGLPWHQAQATYYETARRKYVHSPTYNEVMKPIYNRAVGRWEHYAEALAPLQADLAKYFQAFGYS